MSDIESVQGPVPERALYPLALGFGLLLLPQLQRLPIWLSLVASLGCLWGLGQHRHWWRPLPRIIRALLMLVLIGVFVMTHLGQMTVNTAAGFFILTIALKWTEIERPRDVFVMFMILCYLAAVTFLFEHGILWSLSTFAAVLVLFISLQALSARGATLAAGRVWPRLGWTLLKVLPVVTVLFLAFPRLGPLWSVPLVSERGATGLSESMTPGQFTDLAQSSERAFRVTFGGAAPAPAERYWRGLVLDQYDGRTWSRSDNASGAPVGRVNQSLGSGALPPGQYEILLEPSYQRWAFALRGSTPATPNVSLTEHGLVQFARPVDTAVRYRMQEAAGPVLADVSPELRRHYTDLPADINPRTREWARTLAQETGSPEAFVEALMRHFRQEPFYYTLQPPALSEDSVDAFLFDSLQGFCAHYAGAATFALRSVGIPARVIGGYLGGEYGLDQEYLIVRQYDAHAWVEAWLPQQGWVRLDPTAMVAPERVQQGWREAIRAGDNASSAHWSDVGAYDSLGMLRWASLRLDAADFYWERFVVEYQQGAQQSLFDRFPGSPDLATLGFWSAGFVALVVAIAGVMVVQRERVINRDPLVRYALRWQRWLRRRGIDVSPGRTPMQQAGDAAKLLPKYRAPVMAFARALNSALYNPDPTTAAQDLDQRWRQLKKIPRRGR